MIERVLQLVVLILYITIGYCIASSLATVVDVYTVIGVTIIVQLFYLLLKDE